MDGEVEPMSFLIRPVEDRDLYDLFDLASQFTLLNLPADRGVLSEKIKNSIQSFKGEEEKENANYLFVLEDTEIHRVVGSSLIMAKHGSPDHPHHSFKVVKKEHYTEGIGIGFIHNVLHLNVDIDGPTEIGGLLLDKAYRRRPEKLGRLISFVRFVFMGMKPQLFTDEVLCELSPPLTAEGRSEFWEALGRRFTGLPYAEADQLSHVNHDFIRNLFPEGEIYCSLLDSKARLAMGQVGEDTIPAKHLLEKVGFRYKEEVDPFDGGPHYSCRLSEIKIIKELQVHRLDQPKSADLERNAILAADTKYGFRAAQVQYSIADGGIALAPWQSELLSLEKGQEVYLYPQKKF